MNWIKHYIFLICIFIIFSTFDISEFSLRLLSKETYRRGVKHKKLWSRRHLNIYSFFHSRLKKKLYWFPVEIIEIKILMWFVTQNVRRHIKPQVRRKVWSVFFTERRQQTFSLCKTLRNFRKQDVSDVWMGEVFN